MTDEAMKLAHDLWETAQAFDGEGWEETLQAGIAEVYQLALDAKLERDKLVIELHAAKNLVTVLTSVVDAAREEVRKCKKCKGSGTDCVFAYDPELADDYDCYECRKLREALAVLDDLKDLQAYLKSSTKEPTNATETSSSRPNLQSMSKHREDDYDQIPNRKEHKLDWSVLERLDCFEDAEAKVTLRDAQLVTVKAELKAARDVLLAANPFVFGINGELDHDKPLDELCKLAAERILHLRKMYQEIFERLEKAFHRITALEAVAQAAEPFKEYVSVLNTEDRARLRDALDAVKKLRLKEGSCC